MEHSNAGRESLISEAIGLWETYAETYRTNMYRYLFLATWRKEVRKRHEKRAPGFIPMYVLDAYPELPLLEPLDEFAVRENLNKLSVSGIRYMINTTRYELECNYAYRTVSERIFDLTYYLSHIDAKPCPFGFDTELSASGPFFNRRRTRHASAEN